MHPYCRLPLALAALPLWAAPAVAQTVLYEESFETDIGAWQPTGMFHRARSTNPCLTGIAPFPTGIYGVWYGQDSDCTYGDFQYSTGELTLATPVFLPGNASDARLSFWSYEETEGDINYDQRFVELSTDGGASWTTLGQLSHLSKWYQASFDLTPWLGQNVWLRFRFDSVDIWNNQFLGWVVDDVRVTADACSPPTNFCVAAPNSVGPGAVIGSSGTTSISASNFFMTLTSAPPNQFAHFFYGPQQIAPVPMADGFRCIGPGATGLFRILPAAKIDGGGNLAVKLDFVGTEGGKGWISPGSTWGFQCWYRDPMGPGGNGSNVSDAMLVTFCP